jgi:hypothetical protein
MQENKSLKSDSMKNFLKSVQYMISLFVIGGLLITGVSCSKDSPSAEDVFLEKIEGTWVLSSSGVEIDGEDVTEVFEEFTVTFTKDREYSTSDGNEPIWDGSGTFDLEASSNDAGFHIIRDDDVEVRVDELSETKLVLKFNYVSDGSGRVKSASGEYTFDLEPE